MIDLDREAAIHDRVHADVTRDVIEARGTTNQQEETLRFMHASRLDERAAIIDWLLRTSKRTDAVALIARRIVVGLAERIGRGVHLK